MVSLVNSHTNATSKSWHLWEIDLGFDLNSTPGWIRFHIIFVAILRSPSPPDTRMDHRGKDDRKDPVRVRIGLHLPIVALQPPTPPWSSSRVLFLILGLGDQPRPVTTCK